MKRRRRLFYNVIWVLFAVFIILCCNHLCVASEEDNGNSARVVPRKVDPETEALLLPQKIKGNQVQLKQGTQIYPNVPPQSAKNVYLPSSERLMSEFKDLIHRYLPNLSITMEKDHLRVASKTDIVTKRVALTNTMPTQYQNVQVELPSKGGILIEIAVGKGPYMYKYSPIDETFLTKSGPHAYIGNKYSSNYNCHLTSKILYYDDISKEFLKFLNSFDDLVNNFEAHLN
jgi:hypothetical protein